MYRKKTTKDKLNKEYAHGDYSLVPLRGKDVLLIMKWRNQQIDILRQNQPLTEEDQKKYYAKVVLSSWHDKSPKLVLFSFLKDKKCIGYGGLTNIDWISRKTEISFLVETKRTKNKTCYGKDFDAFLSLIKRIAFKELGLNRLFTETFDIRPFHVKVLERNDFRYEGRKKQHVCIKGKYVDSVIHGLRATMKKGNKNLFIIFGTTSGIGKALYEYASNYAGNNFILANRKSVKIAKENVRRKLTLDLSKSLTKDKIFELRKLFSQQNGYKNIYLILNASVIEPIKIIGFADDELLLKAGYVNFLNYERIINVFISSTRHLHAKKKILAISSRSAESPNVGLSSYCSTKAALEMFIKCLFLEQKKRGECLVIALRPGIVDTNMQKKIRSSKKENFSQVDVYKRMFKQKKLLKPELVARKIYSLLNSDKYWSNPVINISDIK